MSFVPIERPATMQDVARSVGLTKATVSLALRNHPSIPPVTRRQILRAAKQLNYRIHPFVSALMSHQRRPTSAAPHMALGYVTSHPSNDPWQNYPAYRVFFSAAVRRAQDFGCRIEEFSLGPTGLTGRRLSEVLRARGITGVLAAPLPGGETSFGLELKDLAAVGIGISIAEPYILQVANDHYDAARLAVQQCLRLGYRRIAFAVSEEMSVRLEDRWLAAYRSSMRESGLDRAVLEYRPRSTRGFSAGLAGWARKAKPDVVIFGTQDDECWSALPLDVGFVSLGVDDRSGAVAGIAANWEAISAAAVDQLFAQMQHHYLGPLSERRRLLLCSRWLPGRSARGPGQSRPRRMAERDALST